MRKPASNQLSLATIPILGQVPSAKLSSIIQGANMKKLLKKLPILPIIVITAIVIVVIAVKTKAPISHEKLGYPQKSVEVITISKIPFRARITAFGNVEPAILLKSKSEVSGKIAYIHPDLKQGASLEKGTVVLRIEPTTFKISLNQSEAALAGSQSSLVQLEVEEKSTKLALKIAQEKLDVGLVELDRIKSIWEKRLIAKTTLDKEEQTVLSLRQQVQDIEGKLSSYSSRKEAIRAQVKQSESLVNKSIDTLGRTEITLPFDARIGAVNVEKGEFTQPGGVLFEALGIKAVEINAQVPLRQFRSLITGLFDSNNSSINLQEPGVLQSALMRMQLEAKVRLVGNNNSSSNWNGELIRLSEAVDPTRDTLGLVVAVNNPYEGVIPGVRPPLLKGMYTSVELFAPAKPSFVIPRKAIHQNRVYIAKEDNTLDIRQIKILFNQGDLVTVLDDGAVTEGEKLIISDVIPVIQGLPIKPLHAIGYEQKMIQNAVGKKVGEH